MMMTPHSHSLNSWRKLFFNKRHSEWFWDLQKSSLKTESFLQNIAYSFQVLFLPFEENYVVLSKLPSANKNKVEKKDMTEKLFGMKTNIFIYLLNPHQACFVYGAWTEQSKVFYKIFEFELALPCFC